MSNTLLKVSNLTKKFASLKAIDNLSFEVYEGEVLGIIGQNGAGKSTLFRSIMNYFTDYTGEILFKDKPVKKIKLEQIVFLPEERSLDEKSTIKDQIKFFGKLNKKKVSDQKIEQMLEYFEVKGKPTDKIKSLSKGNMQKVQLICALIYEPEFVILDEPFSGLDPYNINLLQNIILDYKNKGKTIIFSSHNMENVEKVSDRLLMLKDGKKELYGTIKEIRDEFERLEIIVETDFDLSFLNEINYVESVTKDTYWHIKITDEKYGEEIANKIHDVCGYVKLFSQLPPTLNEIFNMRVKS
ncbi:MAG: ATP-binding cassette domain-containing protein [Tissierellia bacterium]|nr:ATP-binding cassette domain-containing protein [Tissierellia bacterium]